MALIIISDITDKHTTYQNNYLIHVYTEQLPELNQ